MSLDMTRDVRGVAGRFVGSIPFLGGEFSCMRANRSWLLAPPPPCVHQLCPEKTLVAGWARARARDQGPRPRSGGLRVQETAGQAGEMRRHAAAAVNAMHEVRGRRGG